MRAADALSTLYGGEWGNVSRLPNPQSAAGFFVVRFQIERDGPRFLEPNGQRRKGLADGEWVIPIVHHATAIVVPHAQRRRIHRRRFLAQGQGLHSLSPCPRKDFVQEVVVPAAPAAFADEAVLVGVLIQQGQHVPIPPSKGLPHPSVADARFAFAERRVQRPVAGVFDPPMTPDGPRKPLDTHRQTADGIARLHRRFPIPNARRDCRADRRQSLPQFQVRQVDRHRHGKAAAGRVPTVG